MNDMKCPFCHQVIACTDAQDEDEYSTWFCPRCVAERNWCAFGNKTLWQELIRTRKALETIRKEMSNEYMPDYAVIRDALKKSTITKGCKMKCPYCNRRMFKDEDSGMKCCWSCEVNCSKTKRTATKAEQKDK